MTTTLILSSLLAALVAALVVFFVMKNRAKNDIFSLNEAKNSAKILQEQLNEKRESNRQLSEEKTAIANQLTQEIAKNAEFAERNRNLQEALETDKKEIAELQKKLTAEFENIANRVLKARSEELSETSQKNIGAILNPLGEKIGEFKKLITDSFEKERMDKTNLSAQIKLLAEQNAKISSDAQNLTKALKGDVKKQGNWGEMILERVLEMSGLRLGKEYEREEAIRTADGNIVRPDVIVHLPDNKHIIIDSKVSLTAYDRLVSATNKEEYEAAAKEHLLSVRKHVSELAAKSYQNLPTLNAPDFVLMFVPNEAMFAVALDADQTLTAYAWEKRIVIVSPTTLLATLCTISSIWQQENRTKNAEEIARVGGSLYDKLSNFLSDMEKIKRNIDGADKAYDDAIKKLRTGNGNAIVTAEKLKKMGAKTSKELPAAYLIDENEE